MDQRYLREWTSLIPKPPANFCLNNESRNRKNKDVDVRASVMLSKGTLLQGKPSVDTLNLSPPHSSTRFVGSARSSTEGSFSDTSEQQHSQTSRSIPQISSSFECFKKKRGRPSLKSKVDNIEMEDSMSKEIKRGRPSLKSKAENMEMEDSMSKEMKREFRLKKNKTKSNDNSLTDYNLKQVQNAAKINKFLPPKNSTPITNNNFVYSPQLKTNFQSNMNSVRNLKEDISQASIKYQSQRSLICSPGTLQKKLSSIQRSKQSANRFELSNTGMINNEYGEMCTDQRISKKPKQLQLKASLRNLRPQVSQSSPSPPISSSSEKSDDDDSDIDLNITQLSDDEDLHSADESQIELGCKQQISPLREEESFKGLDNILKGIPGKNTENIKEQKPVIQSTRKIVNKSIMVKENSQPSVLIPNVPKKKKDYDEKYENTLKRHDMQLNISDNANTEMQKKMRENERIEKRENELIKNEWKKMRENEMKKIRENEMKNIRENEMKKWKENEMKKWKENEQNKWKENEQKKFREKELEKIREKEQEKIREKEQEKFREKELKKLKEKELKKLKENELRILKENELKKLKENELKKLKENERKKLKENERKKLKENERKRLREKEQETFREKEFISKKMISQKTKTPEEVQRVKSSSIGKVGQQPIIKELQKSNSISPLKNRKSLSKTLQQPNRISSEKDYNEEKNRDFVVENNSYETPEMKSVKNIYRKENGSFLNENNFGLSEEYKISKKKSMENIYFLSESEDHGELNSSGYMSKDLTQEDESKNSICHPINEVINPNKYTNLFFKDGKRISRNVLKRHSRVLGEALDIIKDKDLTLCLGLKRSKSVMDSYLENPKSSLFSFVSNENLSNKKLKLQNESQDTNSSLELEQIEVTMTLKDSEQPNHFDSKAKHPSPCTSNKDSHKTIKHKNVFENLSPIKQAQIYNSPSKYKDFSHIYPKNYDNKMKLSSGFDSTIVTKSLNLEKKSDKIFNSPQRNLELSEVTESLQNPIKEKGNIDSSSSDDSSESTSSDNSSSEDNLGTNELSGEATGFKTTNFRNPMPSKDLYEDPELSLENTLVNNLSEKYKLPINVQSDLNLSSEGSEEEECIDNSLIISNSTKNKHNEYSPKLNYRDIKQNENSTSESLEKFDENQGNRRIISMNNTSDLRITIQAKCNEYLDKRKQDKKLKRNEINNSLQDLGSSLTKYEYLYEKKTTKDLETCDSNYQLPCASKSVILNDDLALSENSSPPSSIQKHRISWNKRKEWDNDFNENEDELDDGLNESVESEEVKDTNDFSEEEIDKEDKEYDTELDYEADEISEEKEANESPSTYVKKFMSNTEKSNAPQDTNANVSERSNQDADVLSIHAESLFSQDEDNDQSGDHVGLKDVHGNSTVKIDKTLHEMEGSRESEMIDDNRASLVIGKEELEPLWEGMISPQADLAEFNLVAYPVSGNTSFISKHLSNEIEVSGMVEPHMVHSYIDLKKTKTSKNVVIVKFEPLDTDDMQAYQEFLISLLVRKHYAIIGNSSKGVKKFYVAPLLAHQSVPEVFLPFDGPGLTPCDYHILIGVLILSKNCPQGKKENEGKITSKKMKIIIENEQNKTQVEILMKQKPKKDLYPEARNMMKGQEDLEMANLDVNQMPNIQTIDNMTQLEFTSQLNDKYIQDFYFNSSYTPEYYLNHSMSPEETASLLSEVIQQALLEGEEETAWDLFDRYVENHPDIPCLGMEALRPIARYVLSSNVVLAVPEHIQHYLDGATVVILCELSNGDEAYTLLRTCHVNIPAPIKRTVTYSFIRFCGNHMLDDNESPWTKVQNWELDNPSCILTPHQKDVKQLLESSWLQFHIDYQNVEKVWSIFISLCSEMQEYNIFFKEVTIMVIEFFNDIGQAKMAFRVLDEVRRLQAKDIQIFTPLIPLIFELNICRNFLSELLFTCEVIIELGVVLPKHDLIELIKFFNSIDKVDVSLKLVLLNIKDSTYVDKLDIEVLELVVIKFDCMKHSLGKLMELLKLLNYPDLRFLKQSLNRVLRPYGISKSSLNFHQNKVICNIQEYYKDQGMILLKGADDQCLSSEKVLIDKEQYYLPDKSPQDDTETSQKERKCYKSPTKGIRKQLKFEEDGEKVSKIKKAVSRIQSMVQKEINKHCDESVNKEHTNQTVISVCPNKVSEKNEKNDMMSAIISTATSLILSECASNPIDSLKSLSETNKAIESNSLPLKYSGWEKMLKESISEQLDKDDSHKNDKVHWMPRLGPITKNSPSDDCKDSCETNTCDTQGSFSNYQDNERDERSSVHSEDNDKKLDSQNKNRLLEQHAFLPNKTSTIVSFNQRCGIEKFPSFSKKVPFKVSQSNSTPLGKFNLVNYSKQNPEESTPESLLSKVNYSKQGPEESTPESLLSNVNYSKQSSEESITQSLPSKVNCSKQSIEECTSPWLPSKENYSKQDPEESISQSLSLNCNVMQTLQSINHDIQEQCSSPFGKRKVMKRSHSNFEGNKLLSSISENYHLSGLSVTVEVPRDGSGHSKKSVVFNNTESQMTSQQSISNQKSISADKIALRAFEILDKKRLLRNLTKHASLSLILKNTQNKTEDETCKSSENIDGKMKEKIFDHTSDTVSPVPEINLIKEPRLRRKMSFEEYKMEQSTKFNSDLLENIKHNQEESVSNESHLVKEKDNKNYEEMNDISNCTPASPARSTPPLEIDEDLEESLTSENIIINEEPNKDQDPKIENVDTESGMAEETSNLSLPKTFNGEQEESLKLLHSSQHISPQHTSSHSAFMKDLDDVDMDIFAQQLIRLSKQQDEHHFNTKAKDIILSLISKDSLNKAANNFICICSKLKELNNLEEIPIPAKDMEQIIGLLASSLLAECYTQKLLDPAAVIADFVIKRKIKFYLYLPVHMKSTFNEQQLIMIAAESLCTNANYEMLAHIIAELDLSGGENDVKMRVSKLSNMLKELLKFCTQGQGKEQMVIEGMKVIIIILKYLVRSYHHDCYVLGKHYYELIQLGDELLKAWQCLKECGPICDGIEPEFVSLYHLAHDNGVNLPLQLSKDPVLKIPGLQEIEDNSSPQIGTSSLRERKVLATPRAQRERRQHK